MMLCGGDQNLNPRGTAAVAQKHGEALAVEVNRVLGTDLDPVRAPIRTASDVARLDLAPHTRQVFEEESKHADKYRQRRARLMLEAYDRKKPVRQVSYPVQAVRFGRDLILLTLGGEVVVDYGLRAKREFAGENLVVAGYCNDVMCYIPSKRVLQEGGYERKLYRLFEKTNRKPSSYHNKGLILGPRRTKGVILYNLKTKISILHVVLSIGETKAAYNEHCLPLAEKRDISICTYFRSDTVPPSSIGFFSGDGSIKGFLHVLRAALDAREYDVIHVHSPHLGLLFLLATSFGRYHRFAGSAVITVHDSYTNYKLRNRFMFLPVFARFPKVICCSQSSFNSFPALYQWVADNRLGVVQNGLDIARVDRIAQKVRNTLSARTGNFTIVAISRLVDIKNHIHSRRGSIRRCTSPNCPAPPVCFL